MNNINRRAQHSIIELVIFFILVVVFSVGIGYYVVYHGSYNAFYEKKYANEFALVINSMGAGMNVSIDLTRLYNLMSKNNFYNREFIIINNSDKTVFVRLGNDQGIRSSFFNANDLLWNIDEEKRILLLRIVSGEQTEEKIMGADNE